MENRMEKTQQTALSFVALHQSSEFRCVAPRNRVINRENLPVGLAPRLGLSVHCLTKPKGNFRNKTVEKEKTTCALYRKKENHHLEEPTMKPATNFLLLLAVAAVFSSAVFEVDAERPSSSSASSSSSSSSSPPNHRGGHPGRGVPGFGSNTGGFWGPGGGGFGIPGFGGWNHFGGGYGFGGGGPAGGSGWHGVVRPSVVCSEKGPCYKQKLTCPAKCFTSYTHSGKGYGGGGGGGGCTFDCKKCVAHC